MKVGVAVSDLFSGMYAATSILAALRHAERTGEGQHLDVALYDCQIAALANQASAYLATGVAPGRLGNAHPSIAPYEAVPSLDGSFILAVGNDGQFQSFCDAIDAAALVDDPRFATNPSRVANRKALRALIDDKLVTRPTEDWLALLSKAGVPAGPINGVDGALSDPQTSARGLIAGDVDRIGRASPPFLGHPVKYSGTPPPKPKSPPHLGADADAILRDYLTTEEVKELKRSGVVG